MTISVGHGKGKASQLQTSPSSHVFCFTGYKLRKTDPESSNYLRYRRGNVFPDCDCFGPPFWKRDAADNLSRTRNVHDFWQWLWIWFLVVVFYQIAWVTSGPQVSFKFWDVFLESVLWGVCSKDSQGFTLDESVFHAWRVTRGEMRVMEGLRCSH